MNSSSHPFQNEAFQNGVQELNFDMTIKQLDESFDMLKIHAPAEDNMFTGSTSPGNQQANNQTQMIHEILGISFDLNWLRVDEHTGLVFVVNQHID